MPRSFVDPLYLLGWLYRVMNGERGISLLGEGLTGVFSPNPPNRMLRAHERDVAGMGRGLSRQKSGGWGQ